MREEIREIIDNMNADEQVAIHNRYCDEVGYSDDEIFSMDEINEWLAGKDPDEILRMAFYGDFRPCDEYFRFNAVLVTNTSVSTDTLIWKAQTILTNGSTLMTLLTISSTMTKILTMTRSAIFWMRTKRRTKRKKRKTKRTKTKSKP